LLAQTMHFHHDTHAPLTNHIILLLLILVLFTAKNTRF